VMEGVMWHFSEDKNNEKTSSLADGYPKMIM
jgi:hypothetical protein